MTHAKAFAAVTKGMAYTVSSSASLWQRCVGHRMTHIIIDDAGLHVHDATHGVIDTLLMPDTLEIFGSI